LTDEEGDAFLFQVKKEPPQGARVRVALTDDDVEEDLSQYPLATAKGTFKKEDFFQKKGDVEKEIDDRASSKLQS